MGGGEQRLGVSVTAPSGGASGSSAASASASIKVKSHEVDSIHRAQICQMAHRRSLYPHLASRCAKLLELVSSEVTNNSGLFWGCLRQFQRSLAGVCMPPDFVSLWFLTTMEHEVCPLSYWLGQQACMCLLTEEVESDGNGLAM